ncbi:uncharacterized protein LOC26527160 isoform X2 [Drosophila mojavensis]|uniref:THAP-type domain-containing protein n=2 Tax=Drosophila mojavensis TaxID=7230 RepID=A0A0Q9XEG1_DROMO|nr:uncharacterized protein LOC26527160 isoform X2 [Drosophila mojavensis]XP_043865995.1 uncharacterized protein LOC26527160 isoform X2 [Drosophila mojavensis]KRG06693.1 uncharacterized protein Dmoj_GI25519 [Drosophila mojavensis]
MEFCGKWPRQNNCPIWKVCEAHFESECLIGKVQCGPGFSRKLLLKPGAVPTIKADPDGANIRHRTQRSEDHKRRQLVKQILANKENVCEPAVIEEDNVRLLEAETLLEDINNNNVFQNELKERIMLLESQIRALQSENQKLQTALRDKGYAHDKELRKKEFEFSELQRKFEKVENDSKNMENSLKIIFTERQITKLKNKDRRQNWNTDDIARSIIFYSASPNGYRLLRRNNFPLPAIRTLQHWAQKIDICPGILAPAVRILSATIHMSEILSFDERKVRSVYTYDKSADSTLPPLTMCKLQCCEVFL